MNLRELEASDMLDVVHVFFEEDMIPSWEQDSEVKSAARSSIYRELYGTTYNYATSSSTGQSSSGQGPNIYDEPIGGGIKPFIPPTNPEELSSILGAPMGE